MKKIQKIVSLICVIAIVVSTSSTFSFAQYFTDVTSTTDNYIRDAINYVSDHGIMTGVDTNIFGLGNEMTRAQAVFVLYKYSRDTGTYSNTFSDVQYGAWYYNAVGWAQTKQIVTGTSGSQFSPNAYVTREAFMVMLYAYASAYDNPTSYSTNLLYYYTDGNSVSSWALNAVKWALAYGIMPFNSSNMLYPQYSLIREYGALSIHRYTLKLDSGKIGRDSYGFSNDDDFFGDNYYVTKLDRNRVLTFINNYYNNNTELKNYYTQIFYNDFCLRQWVGSCYGMATTAMLDKLGILGVPINFFYSTRYLGEITFPSLNLKSMINVYHFSQEMSSFSHGAITMNNCSEYYIQNQLNNIGQDLFVFDFFYNVSPNVTEGHSVLITNWRKDSNGYYVFCGLDPNDIEKPCWIFFSNNHHSAVYGFFENDEFNSHENITMIRFRGNNYSNLYRNSYDYDGIFNCYVEGSLINGSLNTLISDNNVLQNLNRIEFNFNSDYTLTNDKGEFISFNNGILSGNMKIIREGYVDGLNNFIFYVEDSTSYTLEKKSDNMYFGIAGNGYQMIYNGTGRIIKFSKGQKVEVSKCKSEEFTLTYLGESDSIVLHGKTDSELFSRIKDGQLVISGCKEACRVKKSEIKSQKIIYEKELKPDEEYKVS